MATSPVIIRFDYGTVTLEGLDATATSILGDLIVFDERVGYHRAPAYRYAPIVLRLRAAGTAYDDQCKKFGPLDLRLREKIFPRDYQWAALKAWEDGGRRGVVVLPTGAGKTVLAIMATAKLRRPALAVAPTLDLVRQWAERLEAAFGQPVGMLGGGSREVRDLTVSTYDSAVLRMDGIGDRFGLVIFDECHHLPGAVNRTAAGMCAAPYRLGLTATPEREDDGEELLDEYIGPQLYRIEIDELEGVALSEYDTHTLYLPLDPDEREEYQKARDVYKAFLTSSGVDFRRSDGWKQFLTMVARRPGGRVAFEAYLRQKRVAASGRAKFREIWRILAERKGERAIIFTSINDTAYAIGRRFLLPVITHQTKLAERKDVLARFRSGEYPALVTSRVLNEGVDVPEASVGVIVSGTGSSREHAQRLGRLLRPGVGKRAVLYELVSDETSETAISARRGDHRAFIRKRAPEEQENGT